MGKTLAMLALAGMVAGSAAVTPLAAQDSGKAGQAAPSGVSETSADWAKAMTDTMMRMMGGMIRMWSEMSRPMWQASSQMFGEEYGQWCMSCHVQLDTFYQDLAEGFSKYVANLDGHKKVSSEDMKKALEAYKRKLEEQKKQHKKQAE